MNTTHEQDRASPPSEFETLEKRSVPARIDDTAATLERNLAEERNNRREERFLWLMGVVLLLDVHLLPAAGWGMIPIFLLELVFLIAAARWLGIDFVVVMLQRLFDKYIKPPPADKDD